MEVPLYDGDRAGWLEFKALWPGLAYKSAGGCKITMAKILRDSVKKGSAAALVDNICITGPHSLDDMWTRLCQFYDDAAGSLESALKRIKNLKPVKDDDFKGFVRLVGEVEKAFSQLSSWNQVSCLTMIDVDNLNRLLPSSVKMEWQRRYYQLSQPDRLHPFPVFMQFLYHPWKDTTEIYL